MNNIFNFHTWLRVFVILTLAGCSEEFLDVPPQDTVVDGSYFQTDEQLLAGTALLYNKVWFDYNDKASYNLGDFRGGTAYSAYNDRNNVEFNTTENTADNGFAWRAFYNVVGQSNGVIQNVKRYAGPNVSDEAKAMAIGEARFMRATAYRFLVMNWEAVPIIENNLALLSDTTTTRNTVESVWKFITKDYRAAAQDLPSIAEQPGRVTKWSAEGMLARTYLIRAGVGRTAGNRDQVFLDSAKYYAKRVIEQSGAILLEKVGPNDNPYARLFKFPYDNNPESLFSLQWVYSPGWGTQNSTPAYLAYNPDIANGDGWGGDKSATYWVLGKYEGFLTNGKTLDQRLYSTFMLPGASYPEITQTYHNPDGSTKEQPLVFPLSGNTGDPNFASIKKYVCGKNGDGGQQASSQHYGHDTYMLRLAELYLIYAEAELGNNVTTVDPTAIGYFNKVHQRAGLPEYTGSLTWEMIFDERIVEFAMEGMAWYDLVSLHYYNPQRTYDIISAQDRGLFSVVPDQFPGPTQWTTTPISWDTDRYFVANDGNFALPIPAAEWSQAPNLRKPPVDYYGGN